MIKTAAIFGTGAVGCYFLWGLQEKLGENLWVIAEGERKVRYEKNGFRINDREYHPVLKTPEEAKGVDLLLISAKYDGLRASLDQIAEIVTEHTIVLSLLNGVDSEALVGEKIGMEHMLYSLMHIASRRVGNEVRFDPEKTGGLTYGEKNGDTGTPRVRAVAEVLDGTPLHYHISDQVLRDIWLKMALNVSMNLPQAVIGCPIGAFAVSEHMASLRWGLRDEVCRIAASQGIDISEKGELEKKKYPSAPSAKYSTLQDLEAGRHTEIDMFAGTLIRMGKENGIAVPYCEFVYHAIHALEEKNDGKFAQW